MATVQSVKAKLQGLIDKSNDTTGNNDADLTTAVNALVEGYGKGGYGEDLTGVLDEQSQLIEQLKVRLESGLEESTPLQEKTVEITENGTTEALPDAGFALSKVIVNTNVESGGGGAELNIAYGDTAPADTSKLWVKTTEPSAVIVDGELSYNEIEGSAGGEIQTVPAVLAETSAREVCACVGENLYIFGSHSSQNVYKLNLSTNELTALSATLPFTQADMQCAAVGTNIYVFASGKSVCKFDTTTETVETLGASVSSNTYGFGCAAVGEKVYLFGGSFTSAGTSTAYKTIVAFDTTTSTLSTLSASLPEGRARMCAVACGTDIYLFGGTGATVTDRKTEIYKFDTTTRTVTTSSAALPVGTQGMFGAYTGSVIFLFGGYNGSYSNAIYCFDADADTLTTSEDTLPTGTSYAGCCLAGEDIYLVGGTTENGYSNAILRFVPDTIIKTIALAENVLQIIPRDDLNIFTLISGDDTVEIGVDRAYKGNAEGVGEPVEIALYKNGEWAVIEAGGSMLQEKSVSITENGTVEILPDEGKEGMTKVIAFVNVPEKKLTQFLGGTLTEITAEDWGDITAVPVYKCYSLKSLKKVEFPESVTEIGEYAFYSCSALRSITFPKNLTALNQSAFCYCENVEVLTFPEELKTISNYAFTSLDKISELTIPDKVTYVGQSAFSSCSSVKALTLGKSITGFGSNAFGNMYSLEKIIVNFEATGNFSKGEYFDNAGRDAETLTVYISNTATNIRGYCFYSSTTPHNYISDLVFEEGSVCSTIGTYAFHSCTQLQRATFPASLTSIGAYAFRYCSSAEYYDFTALTAIPTLGSGAFGSIPATCEIRVPAALYDEWIAATNWASYADNIVAV